MGAGPRLGKDHPLNRIYRAALALAVGALAALAPTATATATTPTKATLTGSAACVPGGWQATFTFTNPSRTRTAVITDVDGALDPAVPIRVAPGTQVSDKTGVLTGRSAWLVVEYRWDEPTPSPTVTTPTPTATVVPPGLPAAPLTADRKKPHSGDAKTAKVRAVVFRCSCPTSSPTASPSVTPTVSPSVSVSPSTIPTVSPTPSRTPTTSPTTSPSPTATVPPLDGPASGGALPLTGAPVAYAAAGGGLLLAAGVVLLVVLRRRRTSFTA